MHALVRLEKREGGDGKGEEKKGEKPIRQKEKGKSCVGVHERTCILFKG